MFAVTALSLAACGGGASSKANSSAAPAAGPATTASSVPVANVRFSVLPGFFYTWLPYLAGQAGFFSKNAINATYTVTNTGPIAAAALASSSVDVAQGDISLEGPYLEKGVALTLVSGTNVTPWKLIGAAKEPTSSAGFPTAIAALKGKNVGVVALGSSMYYYTQALVAASGVKPDAVTYQATGGFPQEAAAIEGGRVTAGMEGVDTAYALVQSGHPLLFDMSQPATGAAAATTLASIDGIPTGSLWVRSDWAKANDAVLRRMQLALAETDVWMHNPANFAKVVSLLQAGPGVPEYAKGAGAEGFFHAVLPSVVSYFSTANADAEMSFWVNNGLLAHPIPTAQWYSATTPSDAAKVLSDVKAAGQGALGDSA